MSEQQFVRMDQNEQPLCEGDQAIVSVWDPEYGATLPINLERNQKVTVLCHPREDSVTITNGETGIRYGSRFLEKVAQST